MDIEKLGQRGEDLAEAFLKKQRYKIIERNFSCRFGEIDLVGYHKGVLVFIEVKTRTNNEFGAPIESVTKSKQRKLSKTANYFIFKNKIPSYMPCRFDVVSIIMDDKPKIELIQNAFIPV